MQSISIDFVAISTLLSSLGINFDTIQIDQESQAYGALTCSIQNLHVHVRHAKITPKKIGQFVTVWKRIDSSSIMPYDAADKIDFLLIITRYHEQFGFFIFPRNILKSKDIISQHARGGKLGIRVYPAWDITTNKQAKATQAWQKTYFYHIQADGFLNEADCAKLLCCMNQIEK